MEHDSIPPFICSTYFKNELVILGLGTPGNFGVYLPQGAYKSKKTNLFSGAASFQMPTASPLNVRGSLFEMFPQYTYITTNL